MYNYLITVFQAPITPSWIAAEKSGESILHKEDIAWTYNSRDYILCFEKYKIFQFCYNNLRSGGNSLYSPSAFSKNDKQSVVKTMFINNEEAWQTGIADQ